METQTPDPRIALLREALNEARLQIEYLHGKFSATGSGNAVLARIDETLRVTE